MSDVPSDPDVGRGSDDREVEVSAWGDGFAYVRGDVLVRGVEAADRLDELTWPDWMGDRDRQPREPVNTRQERLGDRGWVLTRSVSRPLIRIEELRAEGYDAQPNHVFYAHSCGGGCPPHPALVHELVRSGLFADPLKANPLKANPLKANPLKANPLKANPLKANRPMENSAVPASGPAFPARALGGIGPRPHVFVLDTGLATSPANPQAAKSYVPKLLAGTAPRISGDKDAPDDTIERVGRGIAQADGYLDPAAGHGTFIAGIIEQLAPGCTITVRRVIGPLGDTDEAQVAKAIDDVVVHVQQTLPPGTPCIICTSFGGQVLDSPNLMRSSVVNALAAGIPIIASAGNDGVCTPQYPAAFPGVIAVAALGPDGPAPWTNYGDWVDACAPGTDLVSAFFADFNGSYPTMNAYDPDRFDGWAVWSGTSFAVPIVAAAIARELTSGRTAAGGTLTTVDAVERVIRAPHLMRLECLGTVVNI